jgi:tetratricopeptide (TPR) repeat protein
MRVETPHFTLLSNADAPRVGMIGRELELLRQALEGTTQGLKLHCPLGTRIYVFADETSFTPFNLGADGKPRNLAGYFVPTSDGNYIAFYSSPRENPLPIVFHEYLHYVTENTVPGMPLWLVEGLAEFYSSFTTVGAGARIGLPLERHLAWLAEHPMLPLSQLFTVKHDSPEYNEAARQGTFYAQSWALVHFLIAGSPDLRAGFGRLLSALERGIASREAFEQAFAIDLTTAERGLAAYVGAKRYPYLAYAPPTEFEKVIPMKWDLERKDTLLALGDLLAHNQPVRYAEAERYVRDALAIDPGLSEGWVTLAFLRLMQEKPTEAVELCRRALAHNDKNARAHTLLGHSLFASFSATSDEDDPWPDTPPPLVVEARAAFRRSLELRPGEPDTLAGLGRTYLFERTGVEEGLSAMSLAWAALPARVDLLRDLILLTANSGNLPGAKRLLVAFRQRGTAEEIHMLELIVARPDLERVDALLLANRFDEARSILETLAREVQSPETAARIREQLAELDAGAVQFKDVDAFNEAVNVGNRGEYEKAARLFDEVAEKASDPAMRAEATKQATSLRRVIQHNRHNAALRAAAEQASAGDYAQASASIEAILADAPDDQIEAAARRMLEELRGRSRRR